MTTITFIGAGNMARSLIMGLVADGYPSQQIRVTNRSAEKLSFFEKKAQITVTTNNCEGAKSADVIVLAVKPQQIKAVCEELREVVAEKNPLIISVAVGVTTEQLAKWLGKSNLAIVRAMPNTPSSLKAGATGLYANAAVTSAQKSIADTIFKAVGLAVWTDAEAQIDIVAAISSSGPAYIFLITEVLQEAGVVLGLSPEISHSLAAQTVIGSARMVAESEEDVVQLRRNVTSPGGTTEQAIKVFETDDIRGLFVKALRAAIDRAKEITQLLN